MIILSWNQRPAVLACIESLQGQLAPGDRLVVVDNDSSDGSAEAVREAFPQHHVIQAGANLGFTGGCNLGMRWALDAGYPWVMLLNSDTRVPSAALDGLIAHAEERPKLGALQPLLVSMADPARIDSMGQGLTFLPGVRDLGMGEPISAAPEEATEIFGACAAAVLFRAEALRESGLFDEDLFILLEDVELMFRIRLAGYTVELLPSVSILHERGVSKDREGELAQRRRFYLQRNIVALAMRYWPNSALLCSAPLLAYRKRIARQLADEFREKDCRHLWNKYRAEHRATRSRMQELGLDEWFGRSL
ncbi:MAG: glycosyltransferase family 2 protein [Planctomycetota bacterium]